MDDKIFLPFVKTHMTVEQLLQIADRFQTLVKCLEKNYTDEERKKEDIQFICRGIFLDYTCERKGLDR